MSGAGGLAIALGCVFAVNLLPAFGPPTWAVLVFFSVSYDLPPVPLVVGGALAAASGRLVLAWGAGRCRGRFSPERLESLAAAREILAGDRRRAAGGLALFALSPVPSAQLFVAAGLLAVPLLPLTAAFFAGRLVSYSLYVGGATLAADRLGDTFTGVFTSPAGLALQVAMLAGLVALLRVDWRAVLQKRQRLAPKGSRKPTPNAVTSVKR
jgi:membrane protein YqaA with SNARE-associated domain